MTKTVFQVFSSSLKKSYQHLTEEDECYFLGEYYSGGPEFYGKGLNSDIHNLKKSMDRSGLQEWRYKNQAIATFALRILETKLYDSELNKYLWVPIPPSAAKSDPMYDDRLVKILDCLRSRDKRLKFREILTAKQSRTPTHHSQDRFTKDEIKSYWELSKPDGIPEKPTFVIFDDVITLGTTYQAAKEMLHEAYPGCRSVGVFLARTKRDEEDYLLNIDQSDFGWTFGVQDEDGN